MQGEVSASVSLCATQVAQILQFTKSEARVWRCVISVSSMQAKAKGGEVNEATRAGVSDTKLELEWAENLPNERHTR